MFATSKLYQGGFLGGLDGADATCAGDAAAAGLDGEFKAWLSTAETSAASRLSHAIKPYVLVDGTKVADDWPDLIHADLQHPIDQDEYGAALTPITDVFGENGVWTNTEYDGSSIPWMPGGTPTTNPRLDCLDWTSLGGFGLLGLWTETGDQWTNSTSAIFCTHKARLYCIEQ